MLQEQEFAQEFISVGGLADLVDVIYDAHGNALAYALTSLQNLMELPYGWSSLDENFIAKVVQILTSSQSLVNVCRPATAILKKLVEADPASAPGAGSSAMASGRGRPQPSDGSVYRYGFQIVHDQMRKEPGLLETVVQRLGSAETAMVQHRYGVLRAVIIRVTSQNTTISMMLINSLLSHASESRWDEFISALEKLNVRKAVVVSDCVSGYRAAPS
jgi:engulfment/cell motility protein 1